MKYQEIKDKLIEFRGKGDYPDGVMLDKATKVSSGNKFVLSHFTYLDSCMVRAKTEKISILLVKPSMDRLITYYSRIKKPNKKLNKTKE